MAKSTLTRRQFLKISALGTTAMTLSNCTSLDRYFMGDFRNLNNEVLILGAGAAGLAAAYELRKRKIPFRVFEASSRVGGRVQSVTLFAEGGPVAELGAEFFESSHDQVHRLAKELNLPISEVPTEANKEAHLFSFNKKIYRVKDFSSRLKSLQTPLRRLRTDLFHDESAVLSYKNSLQFERSTYYDSLSLKDLLESWKSEVDPLILNLLAAQAVARFGVETHEQSALHFIETLDEGGSSLLRGQTQFRLNGGLSNLTQTLAARISGVVQDQFVKMNHALTEISEVDGIFSLTFATPGGNKTFTSTRVICTLPFSKLSAVKGVQKLQFSNLKKENIFAQAYATHSKGVMPFATAFWRNKRGTMAANLGNFTGDFTSQKLWDSGRGQSGAQGLLTFQRGGQSGATANEQAFEEAAQDLRLFYSDLPDWERAQVQMVNWKQRPWAGGSMAVFKPGQYMKYKGVAAEAEYGGNFLFAGEHTSLLFAGTLQGALESGFHAASTVTI